MTLIAHSIEPPFFTIGDVLMSGYKKIPFVSPTSKVDVSMLLNEPDRRLFPNELRRKVYILKENLVVAFSGNSEEIREFLKELRIKLRYFEELRFEDLQLILETYDLEGLFQNSSFYMIHINKAELTAAVLTRGPWNSIDNDTYHRMFANGSGAEGYRNWLDEKVRVISSHPKGDITYLIQINCAFIAKLLTIERYTGATLKDNWGAGFELVMFSGKEFIKYEDIAYVTLEAKFDSQGDVGQPFPVNILYYKYLDEVLVITSIEIYEAQRSETETDFVVTSTNIKTTIFPIFPLDYDICPASVNLKKYTENVSFVTSRVTRTYLLSKEDHIHSIVPFFNQGQEIKVEFSQCEDTVKLTMHQHLIQEVKDKTKELFSKF